MSVYQGITLSPSSLTFDWQCPSCWWHWYVAKDEPRPYLALPKIFNKIDAAIKDCLTGQPAHIMVPGAKGVISVGTRVRSDWFVPDGCITPIRFNGRPDFVIYLDDGSLCIPDAKTAEVKDEHVSFYSPQLHAYAYAYAHPSNRENMSQRVTKLGLYVFEPASFWVNPAGEQAALTGAAKWLEIPFDMDNFAHFMSEVGQVIDSPFAPEPKDDCPTCRSRCLV